MLEGVPKTVRSRGRVYTTTADRRRLGADDGSYGHGTPVGVAVATVDRTPTWGSHVEMATFETTLGYYGEVRLPARVREDVLGLSEGDHVRLTVTRLD